MPREISEFLFGSTPHEVMNSFIEEAVRCGGSATAFQKAYDQCHGVYRVINEISKCAYWSIAGWNFLNIIKDLVENEEHRKLFLKLFLKSIDSCN